MITLTGLRRPIAVHNIIKVNIIVFILWYLTPELMMKHFLVSWAGVESGRVWTLVTSVFSHNMFFHIFINMYAFYGFGMILETTLGTRRFMNFYLYAGILASLSHCFVSYTLMGDPYLLALGASGSVSGVIMLFSLMFPKEKILLLGIIPMPAITAAILFVGLDLWGLIAQTQGGSLPIGHGAHLGGALYGVGYYYLFIKKRSQLYS